MQISSLYFFFFSFEKEKKLGSFVYTKNHTAEAKQRSKMYCNEANKATFKALERNIYATLPAFFLVGLLTIFHFVC